MHINAGADDVLRFLSLSSFLTWDCAFLIKHQLISYYELSGGHSIWRE